MKTGIKHIFFSLVATVVLLVLCYVVNNSPYPYGEETSLLTVLETYMNRHGKNTFERDSVLFLNVGFDKALVNTVHGQEVITDRAVLLDVLQTIQESGYKCVFLDIRLEGGLKTPSDSALVERILKMGDSIVIARHWDYGRGKDFPLIDSRLTDQAAYCDYTASLFKSSYERCQYLQHGAPSAPLKLYETINGRSISGFGWIYKDGRTLCHNSLFVGIPEDFSGSNTRTDGQPKYWNLTEYFYGEDAPFSKSDLVSLCKGKIIVIGDFDNDRHDTYMGPQPGSYLHYLAYDNLRKGRHLLHWWYILMIATVFFVSFIQIARQKRIIYLIPIVKKSKSRLLHFCLSLLGSAFLMGIVSYLSYILFRNPIPVFIPTLAFTICDMWFRYKTFKYEA